MARRTGLTVLNLLLRAPGKRIVEPGDEGSAGLFAPAEGV